MSGELKSFLISFDAAKAQHMLEVLTGSDFGASAIEDLYGLEDGDWKLLAAPTALGKLPAKRLRDALADRKSRASDSKGAAVVAAAVVLSASSAGTITAGAVGPNAQNYVTNIYGAAAIDLKVEPCDFTSIIDSKLSDIKLESFGREWLYDRMYEWMLPPPPGGSHLHSSVLLVAGEPVR